jgi:hypothetical protein
MHALIEFPSILAHFSIRSLRRRRFFFSKYAGATCSDTCPATCAALDVLGGGALSGYAAPNAASPDISALGMLIHQMN